MSFAMLWASLYSLMSKRSKCKFKFKASSLASSVFPTPLGPTNKKLPTGLFFAESPQYWILIALLTRLIASAWAKILFLSDFSKFLKRAFLSLLKRILGILSFMASASFTSSTLIFLPFLGLIFFLDPTSSSNSIALSGKNLSCM